MQDVPIYTPQNIRKFYAICDKSLENFVFYGANYEFDYPASLDNACFFRHNITAKSLQQENFPDLIVVKVEMNLRLLY